MISYTVPVYVHSVRMQKKLNEVNVCKEAENRILQWACGHWKRFVGQSISIEDLQASDFEVARPGHRLATVRSEVGNENRLTLLLEHSDKDVLGRSWSTEFLIADNLTDKDTFVLATRLTASISNRNDLAFSIPTSFKNLIRDYPVYFDKQKLGWDRWEINSEDETWELRRLIEHSDRDFPVVVMSDDPASGRNGLSEQLEAKVFGLGRFCRLSAGASALFGEHMGYEWRVPFGGLRVYWPNVNSILNDDPRRHLMFGSRSIAEFSPEGMGKTFANYLQEWLFRAFSGRYERLDFQGFFAERQASYRHRLTLSGSVSQSAKEDLLALEKAYEENINSLKEQLNSARREFDIWTQDYEQQEVDIRSLRSQNEALQHALSLLRDSSMVENSETPVPETFDGLANWVNLVQSDKLLLHPRAIRSLRNAEYEKVTHVVDGLSILANEYRSMRLGELAKEQFDKALSDAGFDSITSSISPTQLGRYADKYMVKYPIDSNLSRELDFHLAKGSSRDPRFCLRIYFFWDAEKKLVVVGDLPAHLPNQLT
jgi:hypothetical protein